MTKVIGIQDNNNFRPGESDAEGIDLNDIIGVRPKGGVFPDKVLTNLPHLLKGPVLGFKNRIEQEVFLMGAIGAISAIIPGIQGRYNGATVYPNLFIYIVGPYGSGKGNMSWASKLLAPIDEYKREQSVNAANEAAEMGLEAGKEKKRLFIPANSSAAAAYSLLDQNKGRGLIFENEGDTLAETIAQDWGNYSSGLRRAFHHEWIDGKRKDQDFRFKPRLSVVISSTFDQLRKLIPSAENGLFSRFLFYQLDPDPDFHDPFDDDKFSYEDNIEAWGGTYLEMFKDMEGHFLRYDENGNEKEVSKFFYLTSEQRAAFLNTFRELKREVINEEDAALGGTVHRLGMIVFRIAMIFSALRAYDYGKSLFGMDKLMCEDEDFENAMRIVEKLREESFSLFHSLPKGGNERPLVEKKRRLLEALPDQFRRLQGLKYAESFDVSRATYDRFIGNARYFEKIDNNGLYRKRAARK